MAEQSNKEVKETYHHGIPMSDKELEETIRCWKDIEESIGMVMEEGEDL